MAPPRTAPRGTFGGGGFRFGRVAGIDLRVDWSLSIIFALILFDLGAGILPTWHPDWSVELRWAVAIAAAVLFFMSVLAHELSHALVARAKGIPVPRITLFLFGGLAEMDEQRADADRSRVEAPRAARCPDPSRDVTFAVAAFRTLATSRRPGRYSSVARRARHTRDAPLAAAPM